MAVVITKKLLHCHVADKWQSVCEKWILLETYYFSGDWPDRNSA